MSADYQCVFSGSYPANTDLSGAQHKIVTINSSGRAAVAVSGAGDGILQNDDADALGKPCEVMFLGYSQLVVNGASVNIAVGDPIKSSSGIGVKAATDKDKAIAYAEEPATADGVKIRVRMTGINHIGV